MAEKILKGIVSEWNDTKGEGWIEYEEGETGYKKIFAHCSYIARAELQPSRFKRMFTNQDLEKGEIVEFEIFDWKGNKKKIEKFGLRANNIRPIDRIEKLKKDQEEAKAKAKQKKEAKPSEPQKDTDAQPRAA